MFNVVDGFNSVLLDTTIPVITLTGAATINLDVGDTYTELGATALDNIDGDITGSIVITGSVDTGTEGTYYKYYNVSDAAENAATQVARTVVVSAVVIPDTTKPVIVLSPATLTYNLTVGDTFTLPTATLTDNVDSTISISPVSNDVDTATAGAYSVIYSGYEDAAGNVADSVTITVNVFEVTGLLEEIAKTLFSINKKLYTAFKGRGNIETLKFKPIEPIELIEVDADGYFDFDNNEVTKVEFILGDGSIDSESTFLSFDGSELNIETGALDIDSGVYSAMVVVYIGSDTKGTVICGPGLTANCVIDFR